MTEESGLREYQVRPVHTHSLYINTVCLSCLHLSVSTWTSLILCLLSCLFTMLQRFTLILGGDPLQ